MAATASQVVSLESASAQDPHARSYLAPTINALTAQLNSGVRQYNEMVTAAAAVVSSANAGAPMVEQRYRHELTGATDRLLGWAQAFEELGPPAGYEPGSRVSASTLEARYQPARARALLTSHTAVHPEPRTPDWPVCGRRPPR